MMRIAWLIVLLAVMTVGVSAENMTREEAEAKVAALQEAGDVDGLVAALQGEDQILGGVAAMALAETKDLRAYEPLAAIVMDNTSEPEFRRRAIIGLAALGDARATTPLLYALEHSRPLPAALALIILGEPGIVAAIDYLESHPAGDPKVQQALLRALSHENHQQGLHARFVAYMLRLLKSGETMDHNDHLFIAGRLNAPDLTEELVRIASEHPNLEMRIDAICSLGMGGHPYPETAVNALLEKKNSPEIRASLLFGLSIAYSNEPRLIDPVLTILRTHPEPEVKEAARGVLSSLPISATYYDTFSAMLKDPNPDERLLAATVLGKMADPRAVDLLIRLLSDTHVSPDATCYDEEYILEEWEEGEEKPVMVADSAALALARLGDKRAIPALIAALSVRAKDWRPLQARNALRELTGQDFGLDVAAWRAWWAQAGE